MSRTAAPVRTSETPSRLPNIDAESQFFSVPVAILVGLPDLPFDVFIQPRNSSHKILYRSKLLQIRLADDQRLTDRDVRHLFVRFEDRPLFDQAIRTTLSRSDADPELKLALTVKKHQEAFQVALAGSPAVIAAAADNVATDIFHIVSQHEFAIARVVSLLDHDHCSFQHSCNVAIYAAALAKRLDLNDTELKLLTIGALLHDIGKRQIPRFILQKVGPLTARERELICQHPTVGFRELAALPHLTWPQLMMVYQHHEWLSGKGYPVGILEEDIHPWARVCAIADVFDALTANRTYREAERFTSALKTMESEGGHFDNQLFAVWKATVTA